MDNSKTELFESMPIPKAVVTLSVPSVISSLVMVIYSLADTFFVGMMNDPVQNAAVTLAAPLLLAFNAVNNLFGIGSSSMMSRALGRKDYDTVYRSSAFGFYASLICSLLFSLLYGVLQSPILVMLGANAETMQATADYLFWTVLLGSAPSILNVVLAYLVRAEGSSLHASIGTKCGCLLNIVLDPIFILPWGLNLGAAGAGCATCLSNTVACLYFFVLLFVKRGKTYVCIKPSMFRPSKQIVKGVCGVGIPCLPACKDCIAVNLALWVCLCPVAQFCPHFLYAVVPQLADHFAAVGQVGVKAQKIDPVAQRENVGLFVQLQVDRRHKGVDFPQTKLQIFLIWVNKEKVIHIPPIIADTEDFFHVMIKLVKEQQGKQL